jgi:hypothetical protein
VEARRPNSQLLAQVLRGKGPYPVAEYRLAAEVSAAAAARELRGGDASGGIGSFALPDDWYNPQLVAGDGVLSGSESKATSSKAASDGSSSDGAAGGGGSSSSSAGWAADRGARGVYSFCMCPGGQIVPTSTNEEELCLNGMSFSR